MLINVHIQCMNILEVIKYKNKNKTKHKTAPKDKFLIIAFTN